MLVNLPPGEHEVRFNYGMTWVGWTGAGISVLSLVAMVITGLKLKRLEGILEGVGRQVKKNIESISY